jgi:hypothetical protein
MLIFSTTPNAVTQSAAQATFERQNPEPRLFKLSGTVGWTESKKKLVLAPSPFMWDNCRVALDDQFFSEYAGTKYEFHSVFGGETKQLWASEFVNQRGERFQYHPGTKVRVDCFPTGTLDPSPTHGWGEAILD